MNESKTNIEELPFDANRQLAIVGHCLIDSNFYLQCRSIIQPSWFNNTAHGEIWRAAGDFYKKLGRKPTVLELKTASEIALITDIKHRSSIIGLIDRSINATSEFGLDLLRSELTTWYHATLYTEGVLKSKPAYDRGDFQTAFSVMQERMQQIKTSRFDQTLEMSFEDPDLYLAHSEEGYKDGLTTGLGILDAALSPDSTPTPALFRGDTTVLLAASNQGKTSSMITTLCHNILNCKSVLFLTHEGRPEDIREKILCSLMKKTKPELFALYKTEAGIKLIRKMTQHLGKYLTYIPYNKAGMTVEDVVPLIRRKQEERQGKMGVGYDLLVDDYPAKLHTERAKGGQLARRHIDAIVYDYFVQLALEMNLHCLVSIQTNRQGSKANQEGDRLLTMEDVLESWDVMTMATNVITLNRDVSASHNNRLTYYVCKSRSSEVGKAIVANTCYAKCVTHADFLGGVWYRGSETLSDQIDRFMQTKLGQEITPADLKRVA